MWEFEGEAIKVLKVLIVFLDMLFSRSFFALFLSCILCMFVLYCAYPPRGDNIGGGFYVRGTKEA